MSRMGSKPAQKLVSALSPVYSELRTLVGATGMSQKCHNRGGTLFNHVVGELLNKQWHIEAERFGGLEVDDDLEFRRMLHGQIGGF
jgi:hypothetical protein